MWLGGGGGGSGIESYNWVPQIWRHVANYHHYTKSERCAYYRENSLSIACNFCVQTPLIRPKTTHRENDFGGNAYNTGNDEITVYLLRGQGVVKRSNLIDECYKEPGGNFSKIKTGRRCLFAQQSQLNLPTHAQKWE